MMCYPSYAKRKRKRKRTPDIGELIVVSIPRLFCGRIRYSTEFYSWYNAYTLLEARRKSRSRGVASYVYVTPLRVSVAPINLC